MSYSPTADAQALVTKIASNLANATSPGPYTALQSGGVPQLPQQAVADGYLSGLGYQAQSDAVGSAFTNNTTAFTNVFSSWVASVPIAKTYLMHVDVSCFMLTASDSVTFRLLVDSATTGVTNPTNAQTFFFNSLSVHHRISWRQPIVFSTSGNHTIQLQWKTTGTGQANASAADFRCFTLQG